MIVFGLLLRAINGIIALRQLFVFKLGTFSILTVLIVRYVNRQRHRFQFLRSIFTNKRQISQLQHQVFASDGTFCPLMLKPWFYFWWYLISLLSGSALRALSEVAFSTSFLTLNLIFLKPCYSSASLIFDFSIMRRHVVGASTTKHALTAPQTMPKTCPWLSL